MNERDISPPEDSIPLRLVVFAMTMICIGSSCAFIKTSWPIMVMGVTLAAIGSLVAYQNRNENLKWMQLIVIVGVLGVGANALSEFMNPVNGPADFWGPVVHFVAGTFALHTFDLKTRSDINLSALLGALILCFISPIDKSVYFGCAVLAYVILGTAMLFFDCMSRTQSNWLDKPMNAAPVLPQLNVERSRRPSGSAQLTLATLPLVSMVFFLLVPRSDATMDLIVSTFKNFDMSKLMRFVPNFAAEKEAPKTARTPYTPPVRNLGVNAKEHKPKQEKDKEKTPKKDEKDKEKEQEKDKPKAPPKPKAKTEKEDKEGLKPADNKEDKAKSKEREEKKEPKDKKDDKKSPDEKAEKSKENPEAQPKGAKGAKPKVKIDKKALAEQAAKDAAEALKKLGKDGLGKQAAKDAAKALSKGGAGKGHGQSAEVPENAHPYGPGQSPLAVDQIDLDAHNERNKDLFFKVTATRMFFLRRAVFDNFDGRYWTRSKDSLKPKEIKVATLTSKPAATPENQPELSPEEQAAKELEEEKLRSLDGQLSGFGAENAVHYVFDKPEKTTYDLTKANSFIVPKILPTVDLTQSYEVVADVGAVVPYCWIPQTLGYGGAKVTVDDYGQVTGSDEIKKGNSFKVASQLPLYDISAMRTAPAISAEQEGQLRDSLANNLQLPSTLSSEVIDFANEAVGETGNWFTQAQKLCQAVRTQAVWEPEKPSDFEPAEDRVKQFLLDRKLGNSKDFASSFVILCRAVGLPARCVTGFGYGADNKLTGVREIRGKDAFTWAEVFIPDYGWIPFDPTPEGLLPAQARDEGYSLQALQRMIEEKLGMNLTDSEGLSPKRIISWIALIMTALFLLAGIVYALILLWRWYLRKRHADRFKGPAWRVLASVLKDLKKLKIEKHDCETLQQFDERVRVLVKERLKKGMATDKDLPDTLSDFFSVYRAAQYGEKPVLPELKSRAQDVKKLVNSKGK